jgi:hypothetical protein
MTFAELIWKIVQLAFSDIYHFVGIIILLYVIRGGLGKVINRIKTFFTNVKIKYLEKLATKELNNIPTKAREK